MVTDIKMLVASFRLFALLAFFTPQIAISASSADLDVSAQAKATALVSSARARAEEIGGLQGACQQPKQNVDQIPGFAGDSQTSGGQGGVVLQVHSDEDNQPRTRPLPGTLREAVEFGYRHRTATRIVFSPELKGRVIKLYSALRPGDNTTIDAKCTGVTLIADADIALIILAGRHNVIISGMKFRKYPYTGENKARADGKDFRDCITVSGSVDRLAFLHNDFETCGDGELDITSGVGKPMPNAGGHMTIAFNRFGHHDKAMLLGTDGCGDAGVGPVGCPNYAKANAEPLVPLYKVTLFANFFEWAGQRQPRAFGRVLLDATNNVFAFTPFDRGNGTSGSTYGIFASDGALVSARDNLFLGVPFSGRPAYGLTTTTSPGITLLESQAAIRSENNLAYDNEIISQNRPELVPQIAYAGGAELERIDFRSLGARDALACVITQVGPYGELEWPASCQRSGR
ncbi:hypothetical protein MesoLj131b_70310 (plasmid) [Mesorhizobium sp. 131-2-5]|uniref:hypothetical protein n=1 Tax=Mesorhizobium sp. 131-2-5 TaxID=2744519 RepID=UPI0018EE0B38|nr:hypothetical protein [Mesorhizobium sp. 131-2-5]BCH05032.1 hypothetical protein MesoLj131b_70310 [Mesorhizobium sp. 131-2-5]